MSIAKYDDARCCNCSAASCSPIVIPPVTHDNAFMAASASSCDGTGMVVGVGVGIAAGGLVTTGDSIDGAAMAAVAGGGAGVGVCVGVGGGYRLFNGGVASPADGEPGAGVRIRAETAVGGAPPAARRWLRTRKPASGLRLNRGLPPGLPVADGSSARCHRRVLPH